MSAFKAHIQKFFALLLSTLQFEKTTQATSFFYSYCKVLLTSLNHKRILCVNLVTLESFKSRVFRNMVPTLDKIFRDMWG